MSSRRQFGCGQNRQAAENDDRRISPCTPTRQVANERCICIGDAADIKKHFLPTTAEVAIQKARYLAAQLNNDSFVKSFEYYQKPLVAYIGGHDGVVRGNPDWSGQRAWAAWRSKNLLWTKSWRRKVMISIYWLLGWLGGTEVARA